MPKQDSDVSKCSLMQQYMSFARALTGHWVQPQGWKASTGGLDAINDELEDDFAITATLTALYDIRRLGGAFHLDEDILLGIHELGENKGLNVVGLTHEGEIV